MKSILMLVNSTPSSANAQRTWQLARTLHEQGHSVTLFLIQDGVLAALNGETALRGLPRGIGCYVLGEDLALRGFTPLKLREQFQVADYAQLVDLFDQHTRVIGAL
ncbi:MAG: DsrH/TusB family sulfur metabolism protein [Chloroflexota bacterium]